MKTTTKQQVEQVHIYPHGQVEVGTGEPGYRWVPAYSQAVAGGYSQPLTLTDWRAMTKRDSQKLVVHENETAARAALSK